MAIERVLFVNQGITPYVEASHESIIGRGLPQSIQEKGIETRVFMPKYGSVNERKNHLHEVIRLSGQNIIINKHERLLSIKVASISVGRMQTYFIDNEHYFGKKYMLAKKSGRLFSDHDERAIFYASGVIETVKNLGWSPDVVHCHGWLSCLVPLFLKRFYANNPLFSNSKIVYSIYNDSFENNLTRSFASKLKKVGIPAKDANLYKQTDYESTVKLAIDYSDAVVISHNEVSSVLQTYVAESKKPTFEHQEEQYATYLNLYQSIMDK